MKDFTTNYKQKVPTAPAPKTAPAAPKAPAEAAAANTVAPQYNTPNAAPVYRPAQRETQINIPDFLKNRR